MMENCATEIVAELDSREKLDLMVRRISKGAIQESVSSREEFENICQEIIATRVIEANARNEYSRKLDGIGRNVRAHTKSLFDLLIRFADKQKDPIFKKELYLLLCYIKPESPQFVSRITELRDYVGLSTGLVSADFINYILSTLSAKHINAGKLSPSEHFRSTTTLSLAGEIMLCRVAHSNYPGMTRVYCGCSSADSLLFDQSVTDFDIYITLPGLSLRHLTEEFLTAIYVSIVLKLTPAVSKPVTITICVGFVDQLKIAGALDGWDQSQLEYVVEQAVENVRACMNVVNRAGQGLFEFLLYPGCFPVRCLEKATVNGVVPFHLENAANARVVEQLLQTAGTGGVLLFPKNGYLIESALIHDREIHPRLGLEVSALQGNVNEGG